MLTLATRRRGRGYLDAQNDLPVGELLLADVPLPLPLPPLLHVGRLLLVERRQLLPPPLHAALLLLLDERAGPRGGPRRGEGEGGGALAQRLPLVLQEAVLLHHHGLGGTKGGLDRGTRGG